MIIHQGVIRDLSIPEWKQLINIIERHYNKLLKGQLHPRDYMYHGYRISNRSAFSSQLCTVA